MSEVFDCRDNSQLLSAVRSARRALGSGKLVVLPTDTVYGVGADAFTPKAVQALLDAKGRTRQSPPPVLIPNVQTLDALASEVVTPLRTLAEKFWPGALTIITTANPALSWDLGETGGTVALRIPDLAITLELLSETGPLAVSSANKTGLAPARNAAEAQQMLGDAIDVYLDHEESPEGALSSTIVDATGLTEEGGVLRILRQGAITQEDLAEALPQVTFEA